MEEVWKTIKNYPNYQVSDLGRVRSLERVIIKKDGIRYTAKPYILKPGLGGKGYPSVSLERKTHIVSRLVAINFIPNPENKKQVNHIDGNKLNNRIDNLEWVSNLENCVHKFKNKETTSKYTGVKFDKSRGKWVSSIQFNGKNINFGRFKTELDAYSARVKFEKENNITNKYL